MGLPRSGKTSWALSKKDIPIVNPDSIRLALHGHAFIPDTEPMVWVIAKYMVHSLFLAGHLAVIIDATNTSRHRRDFWQPSKNDDYQVILKVIDTPKAVCIKRAIADDRLDLIPIIERMHDGYEEVNFEEEGLEWNPES